MRCLLYDAIFVISSQSGQQMTGRARVAERFVELPSFFTKFHCTRPEDPLAASSNVMAARTLQVKTFADRDLELPKRHLRLPAVYRLLSKLQPNPCMQPTGSGGG